MRAKYLPQDTSTRLHGGVCYYKNNPYRISVLGQTQLQLIPINQNKTDYPNLLISVDDPDLDVSSPKLGYINSNKTAIYFVRTAARKYNQAVGPHNLTNYVLGASGLLGNGGGLADLFYSKAGEDMFLNNYPTYKEVLGVFNKTSQVVSRAISRNIALVKTPSSIDIYYKFDKVGSLVERNGATVAVIPSGEHAWIISKYLEEFDWVIE